MHCFVLKWRLIIIGSNNNKEITIYITYALFYSFVFSLKLDLTFINNSQIVYEIDELGPPRLIIKDHFQLRQFHSKVCIHRSVHHNIYYHCDCNER